MKIWEIPLLDAFHKPALVLQPHRGRQIRMQPTHVTSRNSCATQ